MNDLFNMPIKKGIDNVLNKNEILISSTNEILEKVNTIISNQSGNDSSEMFVINALLSEDPLQNEWAFRQNGIGGVINRAFNLNSGELAACNTVEEIAASTAATNAIGTNKNAISACVKNKALAVKFIEYVDAKTALVWGLGYAKFNVGDAVTLDYYGVPTVFRVVHKNYKTQNKIVLVMENIPVTSVWGSNNNYSSSTLRSYLNSNVLFGFDQDIQNAIVETPVSCHNKSTAVTCNDKIWALSYAEVGFGTDSNAPVEGSALSYFTSNANRIKYFNGSATAWWLRTPYSSGTDNAWVVRTDGSALHTGVSGAYGVVPAFEI